MVQLQSWFNRNNDQFGFSLLATDTQWGTALLHRSARPSGQNPDEQSEGAPHVRRPLVYTPDCVPVLQAAPARAVQAGSAVQRCKDYQCDYQSYRARLHAIIYKTLLLLDCKFNCHKRCAYKVPNDCLGETIGGKELWRYTFSIVLVSLLPLH